MSFSLPGIWFLQQMPSSLLKFMLNFINGQSIVFIKSKVLFPTKSSLFGPPQPYQRNIIALLEIRAIAL